MKTLFLAWQARGATRAWYPIGRLEADPGAHHYAFSYTMGAEQARHDAGFQPLVSFPHLDKFYESSELFPLFQNRVLDPSRKDFAQYLEWLDLERDAADPIDILAVSGGERQTDNLEVFPLVEKAVDNSFRCRFFLHGHRHVSTSGIERANRLAEREELRVSIELNNPATGLAIQLLSPDYEMVGWAPRYLVRDLVHAVADAPEVHAHVVRVNEPPAPANRRVLVEFTGRWPSDYEPMSDEVFKPLCSQA
ncbi:MAG TPA: DNA-binding protein [Kiritimatiellia bacterium]|nr:DNA-binding protein [Kiritimatiellia bacterium]